MTKPITLVAQDGGAVLVREDLEDGNVRVVFADPYTSMSEIFPPEGAEALLSSGEPLKLLQLAAGSEAAHLAKLQAGILELSADTATNDAGLLDPAKVARYAKSKNVPYGEALEKLRGALEKDARALQADTITRYAAEREISFSEATDELAAAGFFDAAARTGEVERTPRTGVADYPFTHEEVLALSRRENIPYEDACEVLFERRTR